MVMKTEKQARKKRYLKDYLRLVRVSEYRPSRSLQFTIQEIRRTLRSDTTFIIQESLKL